jgi:hypothetical protein
MALIWVRTMLGAEATVGPNGERSYRRSFLAKSNLTRELRTAILASPMLPRYGAPHPEDFNATCSKVTPKQHKKNPYLWDVDCEWTTLHGQGNEADKQKPPDQRRPHWSYHFSPAHRYFPRDLDGKLFADSAGTPFDPPPDMPIWIDEVTIQRYEPVVADIRSQDRGYMNGTNTDDWQGAQPNEALIADIARDEVFEQNAWWFNTTYKVLVSPRVQVQGGYVGGWDPFQQLDAGARILNDDNPPVPTPIVESGYVDGRPHTLDGKGKLLAAGADPVYLQFRLVNKVAFAGLRLIPPY